MKNNIINWGFAAEPENRNAKRLVWHGIASVKVNGTFTVPVFHLKSLVMLLWLAFVAINLFATDIEAATPFQGTVSFTAEHPYLNQGNTKWRLLLAPKSYLDSLNLNIQAGDTLSVTGWTEENLILVAQITNSKGQTFSLRNPETMANEYSDLSTIKVDSKQCIACRLCVKPCPTGAISFKAGKAYIDPSKCVECGICIDGRAKFKGCPVGAIK